MKKIIFILFTMLIISCCPNTSNNGYSYGMTKSSESDILERRSRKTMYLYDTKGTMVSSCSAYKGQFDGHTWYVFYGNLSSPTVVHDPLCNCTKKQ
jgi:hypothetical protein